MLSIQKCAEVLRADGQTYSNEEVKKIRELLYQLARIEYENFKAEQNEKGDNLFKGVD